VNVVVTKGRFAKEGVEWEVRAELKTGVEGQESAGKGEGEEGEGRENKGVKNGGRWG